MKKIKLVQFIHGFSTGGAENLVKQYCQLFDKDKIELLVLALHNHHSIFDKELLESDIKIVYIDDIIDEKFVFLPKIIKKILHRIYRKKLVKRIIHDFEPDVIHYHLLLAEYLRYTEPKKETKLFLTVHNEPSIIWSNKIDRVRDRVDTEWLIRNYSFKFIALHEKMRKEINAKFHVADTVIINNGVIIERFSIKSDRKFMKYQLSIPETATVIGHIGRFSILKNHRFMIDVFKEYLKMNPDAVLILIGDGELQEEIKTLVKKMRIEDRIFFLGTRSDIPELLYVMDVMLFPSIFEGMPVTLIEAQVAGIPCLVSDRVTQEVKISNLIHFESLDKTAEEWAMELDELIRSDIAPQVVTKDWDLKFIVKDLENMYIK